MNFFIDKLTKRHYNCIIQKKDTKKTHKSEGKSYDNKRTEADAN